MTKTYRVLRDFPPFNVNENITEQEFISVYGAICLNYAIKNGYLEEVRERRKLIDIIAGTELEPYEVRARAAKAHVKEAMEKLFESQIAVGSFVSYKPVQKEDILKAIEEC